ncbi:MAG: hypothetical protein NVSMB44_23220 [Ktedonobacteraceae bacterium]
MSYLWEGTDVLRNRPRIRNAEQLAERAAQQIQTSLIEILRALLDCSYFLGTSPMRRCRSGVPL